MPSFKRKKKTTAKKRLRFNPHPKEKVVKPELQNVPDVISEQIGKEYTTEFCKEAVNDIALIKKFPENYLTINVIRKSRVVDTFAIPIDKKKFRYKDKEYKVQEEGIYLLPTKQGILMPTSFYKEGHHEPTGFHNTNKGITGKALSLLYMEQLYTSLLYAEDNKYNLFIVILLIACLIGFGVACYFVFMHGGGMFSNPIPSGPLVEGG